jgi:hypothetical protein
VSKVGSHSLTGMAGHAGVDCVMTKPPSPSSRGYIPVRAATGERVVSRLLGQQPED